MKTSIHLLLTAGFLSCFALEAGAWGEPHGAITQGAIAALPAPDQARLGAEAGPLGTRYCFIPDEVYKGPEIAKYAMMDSQPGVTYIKNLHLPGQQPDNYEILRYFMGKAV